MHSTAQLLLRIIDDAKPKLLALTETQASDKPFPDKWSLKEILGHLIDSAANNHQRFVRMQEVPDIGKFSYEQEHWVSCQRYQLEPWRDIVVAWHAYNKHLVHVIEHLEPSALSNVCDIGYPEPATLKYVAEDYVRHVRHHLEQIFSNADPRHRRRWEVVQ